MNRHIYSSKTSNTTVGKRTCFAACVRSCLSHRIVISTHQRHQILGKRKCFAACVRARRQKTKTRILCTSIGACGVYSPKPKRSAHLRTAQQLCEWPRISLELVQVVLHIEQSSRVRVVLSACSRCRIQVHRARGNHSAPFLIRGSGHPKIEFTFCP